MYEFFQLLLHYITLKREHTLVTCQRTVPSCHRQSHSETFNGDDHAMMIIIYFAHYLLALFLFFPISVYIFMILIFFFLKNVNIIFPFSFFKNNYFLIVLPTR